LVLFSDFVACGLLSLLRGDGLGWTIGSSFFGLLICSLAGCFCSGSFCEDFDLGTLDFVELSWENNFISNPIAVIAAKNKRTYTIKG
jgi:hypothetical protein